MKAMKFWIGHDEKLGKAVYDLLTALGYEWWSWSYATANGYAVGCFLTDREGKIDWSDQRYCFDRYDAKEVNIDWMRPEAPETIELGGKTYIKSELEEALKNIKPIS